MSEVRLIENWREKWEPVTKQGNTVLSVAAKGDDILVWLYSKNEDQPWTVTGLCLIPIPQPKTIRPWKREEVLVGAVVRHQITGVPAVIDYLVRDAADFIHVAGYKYITPEDLLKLFVRHDFNYDGSWKPVEQCRPCGVEE